MKNCNLWVCAMLAVFACNGPVIGSDIRVVASIKPVHGLASAVMAGVGSPALLIKGTDSVHGYQLKPSDARMIENAHVLLWIGPNLESSLAASISNLAQGRKIVELSTANELTLLPNRETPGAHGEESKEEEDHDDEDEHGHDDEGEDEDHDEESKEEEDRGHDDEDEHGHDDEGEDEHHDEESKEEEDRDDEDEHGHDHDHGMQDMHIWLDIGNAKVMAREIARALQNAFPEYQNEFEMNLDNLLQRLDALESELQEHAEPIARFPYIVFHDAYQYLERKLNLNNVGLVTVNPERTPGVKKIRELRETILGVGAVCVFSEPQFDAKILQTIAEGTNIRFGVLDPLGSDIDAGPDAYFQIMRSLVDSLQDCLSPAI